MVTLLLCFTIFITNDSYCSFLHVYIADTCNHFLRYTYSAKEIMFQWVCLSVSNILNVNHWPDVHETWWEVVTWAEGEASDWLDGCIHQLLFFPSRPGSIRSSDQTPRPPLCIAEAQLWGSSCPTVSCPSAQRDPSKTSRVSTWWEGHIFTFLSESALPVQPNPFLKVPRFQTPMNSSPIFPSLPWKPKPVQRVWWPPHRPSVLHWCRKQLVLLQQRLQQVTQGNVLLWEDLLFNVPTDDWDGFTRFDPVCTLVNNICVLWSW